MRIVKRSKTGATMELSREEIGLLTNALNYVCHGVALDEFATLFGAEKREAAALLDALSETAKG